VEIHLSRNTSLRPLSSLFLLKKKSKGQSQNRLPRELRSYRFVLSYKVICFHLLMSQVFLSARVLENIPEMSWPTQPHPLQLLPHVPQMKQGWVCPGWAPVALGGRPGHGLHRTSPNSLGPQANRQDCVHSLAAWELDFRGRVT
jgi:hypothetical protein